MLSSVFLSFYPLVFTSTIIISSSSDLLALSSVGVEVLSIIANKQKTKHFLENRIQADLSAAEHSPNSTTSGVESSPALSPQHGSAQSSPVCPSRVTERRSRMSAPVPLCAPGPADPGSGSAGWRRSSSIDAAAPESRIAREIREQRCREEELRRLRSTAGPPSPAGHDDTALSGYGSEEKDSLIGEADR